MVDMSCASVPHLAHVPIDELDTLEERRLRGHAAECHTCAREVAELRRVATQIAALVVVEPPSELKRNILRIATTLEIEGQVEESPS